MFRSKSYVLAIMQSRKTKINIIFVNSKAIFNNNTAALFKNSSAASATPLQFFNKQARCFHATPASRLGGNDNVYVTYKNKFKQGRSAQKIDEFVIPATAVNKRVSTSFNTKMKC